MNDIKNKLAKRIKKLRQDRELTQEQLAERANISIGFLGGIERGVQSPTIETLSKIADGLKINLRDLVSFDDAVPSSESDIDTIVELLQQCKERIDSLVDKQK